MLCVHCTLRLTVVLCSTHAGAHAELAVQRTTCHSRSRAYSRSACRAVQRTLQMQQSCPSHYPNASHQSGSPPATAPSDHSPLPAYAVLGCDQPHTPQLAALGALGKCAGAQGAGALDLRELALLAVRLALDRRLLLRQHQLDVAGR